MYVCAHSCIVFVRVRMHAQTCMCVFTHMNKCPCPGRSEINLGCHLSVIYFIFWDRVCHWSGTPRFCEVSQLSPGVRLCLPSWYWLISGVFTKLNILFNFWGLNSCLQDKCFLTDLPCFRRLQWLYCLKKKCKPRIDMNLATANPVSHPHLQDREGTYWTSNSPGNFCSFWDSSHSQPSRVLEASLLLETSHIKKPE